MTQARTHELFKIRSIDRSDVSPAPAPVQPRLQVSIHVHALVLDGVFAKDRAGVIGFHPLACLTDLDVAEVLATVEPRQYKASRLEVIIGALFAALIAWFIIVACAATYLLFAAGLFNDSLFAATILPISTSYAVCEGLGFEAGLDKKFHEAPVFYWLYTLLIALGAGVLLIPQFQLSQIMVFSQVVNGMVLPFVLIFMLLLTNDKELMGEHVNSRIFNAVAWVTVITMIALTFAMFVTQG